MLFRSRLFHEIRDPALEELCEVTPTMSKVPFLRWRKGQRFQMATHGLVSPMKLAPGRGALLHFKMFDDLPGKCETETARAQYFRGGAEYTVLGAAIRQAPNHSFYDPKHSIRYEGTQQLEALGMLSRERPF